ncbi:MAG: PhzF family phenazine biosynthesis protein [Synergistaceae bacterium]|nr:PhzF family phenazine biosynthesis protein [Synergistaceae bacterium]
MKQYVADAFTDKLFAGNPAAICVMDKWLPDTLMQEIARENNLSETAFTVKGTEGYYLRWFTPGGEIDLCGHATLAAAYVLFRFYEQRADKIAFQTKSGQLEVARAGELLKMDFPAYTLEQTVVTDAMEEAIGVRPLEALQGRDLLCVLEKEEQVYDAKPDPAKVMRLDGLLLHITTRSARYDCISRSFAPKCGVAEDPVCGSGHCHILPYWANKLQKQELTAYQASARGGVIYGKVDGGRVQLAGKAALYSAADIFISD